MIWKSLLVILISTTFFLSAALPAHAGGMPSPVIAEEDESGKMPGEIDEPAEKMPVIEYEELVADEEPEEERARAWPWVIIGFLGAVFISAL
jgi:hypothetical protein